MQKMVFPNFFLNLVFLREFKGLSTLGIYKFPDGETTFICQVRFEYKYNSYTKEL